MYVWIWRHLPGNVWLRMAQVTFLIAVVVTLLEFVVFPWVEPKFSLWFTNNGTVSQ